MFIYFKDFILGLIVLEKRKTITQIYLYSGSDKHYSNYHRFLSHYKWSIDIIISALIKMIVQVCVKILSSGEVFGIIDDTLHQKSGMKMFGLSNHHNCTGKKNLPKIIWGHNWVVIGLVFKDLKDRWLYFPIKALMYIRKRDCENNNFKTKLELGVELAQFVKESINLTMTVITDAFYSKLTYISGLFENNIHFIGRLRKDSALFNPIIQREKRVGRPRKYGKKIDIKGKYSDGYKETINIYNKTADVVIYECDAVAKWCNIILRIVVVFDEKKNYCIFVTDRKDLSGKEVIEYYGARWNIELSFRDEREYLGFSDYQNRIELGIKRYVNLTLIAGSILRLVHLIAETKNKKNVIQYDWYKPKSWTIGLVKSVLKYEISKNKNFLRFRFLSEISKITKRICQIHTKT
jgi:SRSO17 transposase